MLNYAGEAYKAGNGCEAVSHDGDQLYCVIWLSGIVGISQVPIIAVEVI